MENLKKTALFLMAALLGSNFTNIALASYPDTKGHWSEQFVELLNDKGIVHGDNYGNYRPDDSIKVDEFLKLTLEASGYDGKSVQGYWADDYIKVAYERVFIYDEEIEDFKRPITRGEAARTMVRALGLEGMNIANKESVIREITDYYDTLNE